MTVFETERLRLRPLREDDVDLVFRLMSDPRVFFWRDQPVPRSEAERFVETKLPLAERGLGWWLISGPAENGASDGFVGLACLQILEGTEEIELGYSLVPPAWGHGYATEAGRCLLDHGFGTIGAERIVAVVLPENERSLRVVHKLGFADCGERLHANRRHRYLELTRTQFAASDADAEGNLPTC